MWIHRGYGKNEYLCIRYAALDNLRIHSYCTLWQYLCIRYAALGNERLQRQEAKNYRK